MKPSQKLTKYMAATDLTAEQIVSDYKCIGITVTARQLDERVLRDADEVVQQSPVNGEADICAQRRLLAGYHVVS